MSLLNDLDDAATLTKACEIIAEFVNDESQHNVTLLCRSIEFLTNAGFEDFVSDSRWCSWKNGELEESEYDRAVRNKSDTWVPACGGKEEPFVKNGRTLLYCFNPYEQRHAYLDVGIDCILSDEEVVELLENR